MGNARYTFEEDTRKGYAGTAPGADEDHSVEASATVYPDEVEDQPEEEPTPKRSARKRA